MCTYTCTCILCVYDVPRPGRMDLCTSSVVLCNGRLLYFDRGEGGEKERGNRERERERETERETERKGGREKNRERVRDSTKHHYIMSRNC